jgi:hypothetical protein
VTDTLVDAAHAITIEQAMLDPSLLGAIEPFSRPHSGSR